MSGMLLVIDVGNTNAMFSCFQGEHMSASFRLRTDRAATLDEWGLSIIQLLDLHSIFVDAIDAVIIGSVVPQIERQLRGAIEAYLKITPIFVSPENAGIGFKLNAPHEVGADRYINAKAAFEEFGCALVIIDFGTATTYDVVDGDGDYIGGLIAPGIDVSLEALCDRTAKLPRVEIKQPEAVIGTDTRTAMQSGLYYTYLGGIDRSVRSIWYQLGHETPVIATGGLAPFFSEASDTITHVRSHLTMDGLRIIFNKLKGQ